MTTLNTIIEEEKKNLMECGSYCNHETSDEHNLVTDDDFTSAMQRAYEAGYKLAVEHLKEAYTHNATTTVPEAIEWLEDNSKYQDKK